MTDEEFNSGSMKLFDAATDDHQRMRVLFQYLCKAINILKSIKEKLDA